MPNDDLADLGNDEAEGEAEFDYGSVAPEDLLLRVTRLGAIYVRGEFVMFDPWAARQLRCTQNLPNILGWVS